MITSARSAKGSGGYLKQVEDNDHRMIRDNLIVRPKFGIHFSLLAMPPIFMGWVWKNDFASLVRVFSIVVHFLKDGDLDTVVIVPP